MLRIYSGVTSGIGLWAAFIANLLILGLAIWGESGLLVVLSITISVLIICDQLRLGHIGNERRLNNRRLFVSLREDNYSGHLHWAEPDKILGFTFSEMFLKAGKRKKGLRIGSRQCLTPFWTSVCNIEIPLEHQPGYGFLRGLGMASWTSGFSCSVDNIHLPETRHGNNWLRLSVSMAGFADINVIKKALAQSYVRAIELCLTKPVAGSDDQDYENRLLEFVKELRQLSGGKPVGFRLVMLDEDYTRTLCKKIWESAIIPDFIVIDYNPEKINTVGELYRYLTLINRELEGFCLRDQVRILVSCQRCYIHQLIRMRYCGADGFMIVSSNQEISEAGFDDCTRSCFSVLVHRHRQWIQEIFGSGYEEVIMEDKYATTEVSRIVESPSASIDTNCRNILKKFIYHFN